MMTECKIQQLRAAVLTDLREFIPEGYYSFVRTGEDVAYGDIRLATRLQEKQYKTPQLTPRQLTAVWLLERIGLYCHKYESSDPAADSADEVTPESIKVNRLEHLQAALVEYAKYFSEGEAAALMGAPDEKVGDGGTASDAQPCADFQALPNLSASEVSIEFAAGESGGVILNVSARNVTRRIALADLDLIDHRNGAMNTRCGVMLRWAIDAHVSANKKGMAKRIDRLRKELKERLGIIDNPIVHQDGVGYVPRFRVSDKRDAADKRAKREAERRTVSLNKLEESGMQVSGGIEQADYSFEPEGDATDEWLERNVS